MTDSITKKVTLYVAATFILGAASGAVLGYTKGRHPDFKQRSPEEIAARVKTKFTKELSLSAEQQQKIYPIIEETVRRVEELRRTQMTEAEKAFKESHSSIAALLDEKQKARFEEMELRRPKFQCHPKPGEAAAAPQAGR